MTERVHTVVIGAGVVGLAIARRLAQDNGDVLMIERADSIGSETSSRNSEVIHAGMYYAAGSLKARTCVAGRRMLYDYCGARGVEHRRTGKLIVATDDTQLAALDNIVARAQVNGLTGDGEALQRLDGATAMAMEPGLRCVAALLSPSTGIIDTHALMLAYLADAEHAGATLVTDTEFIGATRGGDEWRVRTHGVDGDYEFVCTNLVNAAGLHAQSIARTIEGLAPADIPPALWLKGNYFAVAGRRPPFRHLIYPVPSGGGLGVHLTMDLAGQARFGPDTEAVPTPYSTPDYRVDPRRADVFYDAIRRYWPELPDDALVPAYSGMRPKAGGAIESNDFEVRGPGSHGLPGLVNLFGIESPGITASLALAELVASQLP
jgi:L-2-hydroxyglutarate oxidase LhgO